MEESKEDLQKRLFEITADIESLKKTQSKNYEELEIVLKALGIDTYHQDPLTNVVYKITLPAGTFVPFRQIDYIRTNLSGEKRGGSVLSQKEAKEKGFNVKAE